MKKSVVIVESPSKAKTINKYLGDEFKVLASFGHIRDLPSKNGSVDPANDFSMIWELDSRGEKSIAEIKKELQGAKALFLATDPDREGEAISWHVKKVLEGDESLKDIPCQRIVFYEITKNAVQQAFSSSRPIDQSLVDAYLARRALDYLVGFTLSPVLWRKLPGARSAGRVQSVALRLIVEREEEIEKFQTQEYWSLHSLFNVENKVITSRLVSFEGKKLEKFDIPDEEKASFLQETLKKQKYNVLLIEKKNVKKHPTPPFITSTLQQEASRKLGFSASKTMIVAQKLYEGIEILGETTGLITYMRTDSVHLAKEAVFSIRDFVEGNYGASYLPSKERVYKNKVKNSQEAHEGIRPTVVSCLPESIRSFLDADQFRLYELIWKRTVASQMESALFEQVSIDIAAHSKTGEQVALLRTTGSTLVFDGFLRLYQEGEDDASIEEGEVLLPSLKQGQKLDLEEVTSAQHFTQPAPHFSEASLVKRLEELGIGRPSTYASLLQVLQDRKYVSLDKKKFIPQSSGRFVTSFLKKYFSKYVEYDFTAQMEERLDDISSDKCEWREVLKTFWVDFNSTVESTSSFRISDVIDTLEEDLKAYLFSGKEKGERPCPSCEQGQLGLRLGKYGAFIGCSSYPTCSYVKPLKNLGKEEEHVPQEGITETLDLGKDRETGESVFLKKGPYGFYFEWQALQPTASPEKGRKKKVAPPKRVSLPKQVSVQEATLDLALILKKIPITLGVNPVTGEDIILARGKFGPYIKCGEIQASIPRARLDFWTFSFSEALTLLTEKEKAPRTRKKVKDVA